MGRHRRKTDRYFGRFCCRICRRSWTSSHVYTKSGTLKVLFLQRCKFCDGEDAWVFPYQLQMIECNTCGETPCVCVCEECGYFKHTPMYDDDYYPDEYCQCKRHRQIGRGINLKKPHLAHLCERCQMGFHCTLF